MTSLPPLRFPLTIWHKPHWRPYYFENSARGVRHARAVGALAIDLDCQITADGVVVATHWPEVVGRGGFLDPHGHVGHHQKISHLRWAVAKELRTPDGYFIWTATELIQTCADAGITPCFEVKDDRRFEDPGTYAAIAHASLRTGVPVVIMTLPHLGGRNRGYRRLRAAKAAGLTTMVLTGHSREQRGRVPADQWKHVDMSKGPYARLGKPAEVIWLGPGSKYGQEVGDRSAARITRRLKKRWAAA